MKLLRVIVLLFLFVGVAFAQTGAPPFPTSPTLGEEVTGPNGQVYKWDGTKWVAGVAPFVPPDGSVWTATGLTGVASLGVNGGANIGGAVTIGGNLNVTGITTHASIVTPTLAVTGNLQIASGANLLFNGFPMGGTCPVGEYVNALSAVGALTCTPIVGGGGTFVGATPPTTPAIGQLWFNTVDLQTYVWYNDGTSTQWVAIVNIGGGGGGGGGPWLPVNNPAFTGTMTGTAGANQFVTLSTAVNQAAPLDGALSLVLTAPNVTVPGNAANMLSMTSNGNWPTVLSIRNTVAGPSAYSALYMYDDVPNEFGGLFLPNTGNTALAPNILTLFTDASGGLGFVTQTVNEPMKFWIAGENLVRINGATGVPAPYNFALNVVRASVNNTGGNAADLMGLTANGNWTTDMAITNTSTGTSAASDLYLYNETHYAALQLNGLNSTINGLPGDSVAFQSNTAGGLFITDAANAPIGFLTGAGTGVSGYVAYMDGQGIHVSGTGNYWLGTRTIPQSTSGGWVPQIQFGGSSAGVNCNVCDGAWSVSGQNVTVSFVMNLNTTGTSGGSATVVGLPANLGANMASNWYGTCAVLGGMNIGPGSIVLPQMAGGASAQILLVGNDPSTNTFVGLGNGNILNGVNLQCTISYMLNI